MSFINPQAKEINCKIAYCGPKSSGKSTSLHALYEKVSGRKGKMMTLSEEQDGSLFFDFLPLSLGKVKGYTIRFHVYTVPTEGVYDSSQKLIFKGVDGVVFVLDSRIAKLEENLESWKKMDSILANNGIDFKSLPVALQYNKRDLSDILPVSELQGLFNNRDFPEFETVAKQGKNVMECFQAVAKKVLLELKKA